MTIKAVLLDSGGVLMQPRRGRWNPRFDFEKIVTRRYPHIIGIVIRSVVELLPLFGA